MIWIHTGSGFTFNKCGSETRQHRDPSENGPDPQPRAFSPTYGMDGVVVEPGRVGGDDNVVGLLRQIVLRLLNLLLLL